MPTISLIFHFDKKLINSSKVVEVISIFVRSKYSQSHGEILLPISSPPVLFFIDREWSKVRKQTYKELVAITRSFYVIPTRESKDKSPFDVDYLFLSFQCSLAPRRHRRIYMVAKQWLFKNNIGRLSASGRSTLPSISRQFHCVTYRDRLILRLILVAFRILREIGVCIYIYID